MMGCQVNSFFVKIAFKNSASFFSERPTATVTTRTSTSATYYLEHSAKRQIRLIIFLIARIEFAIPLNNFVFFSV
jgi:hypothetical protein